MSNVLARKLSRFVDLRADEIQALSSCFGPQRELSRGEHLIAEGENPQELYLILDGWAYRYRYTSDGKRQIYSYLIPGDTCDIRLCALEAIDHSIGALCDLAFVPIAHETLARTFDEFPRVERAMLLSALVDEGIMREWLTSAGQRSAEEAIAHLFYEIWFRRRAVGLDGETFPLPLTQQEIGDSVGLTPVHVNRSLQKLRKKGIISFARRELTIHDPKVLAEIASFEDAYLRPKGSEELVPARHTADKEAANRSAAPR